MKTTIQLNNVWSSIRQPSTKVLQQINKWESKLSGPYGVTHSDGRILSGVIPDLFDPTLCTVVDQRTRPCIPDVIPTFVDRDYQITTVSKALFYGRGLLKLPTGAGKSVVVAGIAKALKCSHLILVHKAHLVEDLARTLHHFLKEDIGRVHGTANDYNKRIVCATFKSLYSRPELLTFIQSRESVMVDECHVLPALTHFAVMLNTLNAYYRFGLSATPLLREDERDIHTVGLLGPIIYEVTNQELYTKGYVVPPEVTWLNAVTKTDEPEYFDGYIEAIVDNIMRNSAITQALSICEKPAIVFVKSHKHQQNLLQLLNNKATVVNQYTPLDDRKLIAQKMKLNEIEIVIATNVFNEGVDVPNLQTVINATASSSWIAAIQEPGRGARPFENKTSFKLYDFNDRGHRWFEQHTAQRYAAYHEAGFKLDPPAGTHKVVDLHNKQGTMKTAKPTRSLWYRLTNDWAFMWLLAPVIIWLLWKVLSR